MRFSEMVVLVKILAFVVAGNLLILLPLLLAYRALSPG